MESQKWVYNDGGRSNYFSGENARDCVARSIAIASGMDYKQVYETLAKGNASDGYARSARNGIYTKRKWFKDQMREWGFEWVSTMGVGTGVQTHLHPSELPKGRIICKCSRHLTAVIDGVINDTYDPSRGGKRAVYGYWIYEN